MKILHLVTNSDLGGAPRVVIELSNMAVNEGHSCYVASKPEGPMWLSLDDRIAKITIESMRREVDILNDVKSVAKIIKIIHDINPDIIHIHSSKAGVLGRIAALLCLRKTSKKTIYTIHGFDTILKKHKIFLPLEKVLSNFTGALVAVSEYDRINLDTNGIKGNKFLIRNGVTDRRWKENTDAGNLEIMRLLASAKGPIVMTIARVDSPKRPDLFISTAAKMQEYTFIWIGNNDKLGAMVAIDKIPDNVIFTGEVAEAGNLAKYCDIFVLFSDYEGLPMSILEAMSCGRPVVASAVGGIPEIMRSGSYEKKMGIMVENKTDRIIEGIQAVQVEMGYEARIRYEKEYTVKMMWDKYNDLYSDVAAKVKDKIEALS